MFIKNYSDVDFPINYHSRQQILPANAVTQVDENWISYALVKAMFGNYVEKLMMDIPIEEYLYDYKNPVKLNTIYKVSKIGPSRPRIFIKDSRVDIYWSDEETCPKTIKDMSLFSNFIAVDGLLVLEEIAKWVMLVNHDTAEPEIVFVNVSMEEQ